MTKYAGKKPYPFTAGDDKTGQCSECGEAFFGERAFDLHRYDDGVERACHDPSRIVAKPGGPSWWLDTRGRWHHSKPMTQDDRDRVRGTDHRAPTPQERPMGLPGVPGTPGPARSPERAVGQV